MISFQDPYYNKNFFLDENYDEVFNKTESNLPGFFLRLTATLVAGMILLVTLGFFYVIVLNSRPPLLDSSFIKTQTENLTGGTSDSAVDELKIAENKL